MCSGRKIQIKGFTVKDGKVKRGVKHLDVSTRLKQASSKRVRVAKGRTA